MQTLVKKMRQYYDDHTNHLSRSIHIFAIVFLTLSLMIITSWVKIAVIGAFTTSLMWVILVALVLYYVWLNILVGIVTGLFCVGLAYIVSILTVHGPDASMAYLFAACFVLGWVLHFVALLFSGSDSYSGSTRQLLLGPLFVVAALFFALGYQNKLQQRIIESRKQIR